VSTQEGKHTPGPWVIAHKSNIRDGAIWAANECVYVAQVYNVERQTDASRADERQANARLIAAAPELLEALEACLSALDLEYGECDGCTTDPCTRCRAKAAISKARGRVSGEGA